MKFILENVKTDKPRGVAVFGLKITTLLYTCPSQGKVPAAQIMERTSKDGLVRTSVLEIEYQGVNRRGEGHATGRRRVRESLIEALDEAGVKNQQEPYPENMDAKQVLERLADALKIAEYQIVSA